MNESNLSAVPSAPASAQRYLIALPTDTEGPYTVEELRNHLRTRRLNPSDRVICEGDKKSRLLSEIIPDAEALQVRTDSVVRRKATDGEGHSPETTPRSKNASDSQIRRYRTPLNVPALPAESIAPPTPKPVTIAAPERKSNHLGVVVAALVCCVSFILWQSGVFDSYGGGHPGLRWRVTFQGGVGGPWTLILAEHDLTTISPTDQTLHFSVHQSFETGGRMRLNMEPPHPQLGKSISISSDNPAEVTVEQDKGSGEVLH